MLAYAANTRPLGRTESPKALVFIVAGHALLLGALFMARTEISRVISDPPEVTFVRTPKPPPPDPVAEPTTPTQPATSTIDRPQVIIPTPRPLPPFAEGPRVAEINPYVGPVIEPVMPYVPPRADPVRVAARFITPDHLLRPPYPAQKQRAEEEATLRLRLSVDPRGRVVAVDPVGSADPMFLAAARRHILKAWRYKPAMEDGAAVASSVVITLSFRLEDA